MNHFGSSCLLFLCSFSLVGTLSAQGPPASRGVPSPASDASGASINVQTLLLPHRNCGTRSALPFGDAATRRLLELGLKIPSQQSPATLAPTTRFLPQLVSGIDATSDVVVNVTLTQGNVISGSIVGSGTATSITAWDAAGDSFTGTIDRSTSTYAIVVSPGIYNLTVCRQNTLPPFGFPGPTDTFTDPNPVDVTQGDAMHDVTVPDLTLLALQGTVVGIDPTLFNSVSFVATNGTVGADALLDSSGHYGGFPPFDLPAGTYIATLNAVSAPPAPLMSSTYVLATITITDSGTLSDLTKPAATTLSGMVSMADTTPPPANTFVLAAEPVTPPPPGTPPTCFVPPVNQALASPDSNGLYTLNLTDGITVQDEAEMPVLPADPSTSQSQGVILVTVQNVVVSGPTMQDIVAPPLPGISNVSGEASDSLGNPVGNVNVTAFTNLISGTIFARTSLTGPDGMYILAVLANAPYNMGFIPANN